jgi:hypothetical protein
MNENTKVQQGMDEFLLELKNELEHMMIMSISFHLGERENVEGITLSLSNSTQIYFSPDGNGNLNWIISNG